MTSTSLKTARGRRSQINRAKLAIMEVVGERPDLWFTQSELSHEAYINNDWKGFGPEGVFDQAVSELLREKKLRRESDITKELYQKVRASKKERVKHAHASDCDAIHGRRCSCSIHPGRGRGIEPKRVLLTGKVFEVVRPHAGHTITVQEPVGVCRTPAFGPSIMHWVTCSCGEEWLMDDSSIQLGLKGKEILRLQYK